MIKEKDVSLVIALGLLWLFSFSLVYNNQKGRDIFLSFFGLLTLQDKFGQ